MPPAPLSAELRVAAPGLAHRLGTVLAMLAALVAQASIYCSILS